MTKPTLRAWLDGEITIEGWTTETGEAPEGYDLFYYFDIYTGEYRGPDEYGIEPVFVDVS